MSEIPLITRLVVKNYRSLANIDVAFSPLTVLVGENGAGKSNLIDVLRFVRDALTDGFESALESRGGFDDIRCWFAGEDEDVSIQLYFSAPDWQGEYGFAFGHLDGKQVAIKSEQLSITKGNKPLFFKIRDGQLVSIAPSLAHPKALLGHALALCEFPEPTVAATRHFLAKMSFYDLSPDTLRKPQVARQPFPLLETGENLASTLQELQRRQHDDWITNALEVVVEGLDGYQVYEANQHLVTKLHYTFHNGKVRQFSSHLKNEADGTVRMLGILTALYQERVPSPLAFEEPEKALYTDVLALLCEILETLDYQVLLTSHRPDFINDLPVDSFLVVSKEDGISQIGGIIYEQRQIMAQQVVLPGELMQMQGLYRQNSDMRAKV